MMDDLTFTCTRVVQCAKEKKKTKFGWSRQFHSLTQCRIAPAVQSIMGRGRREGTEKRLQFTDAGPGSHLVDQNYNTHPESVCVICLIVLVPPENS